MAVLNYLARIYYKWKRIGGRHVEFSLDTIILILTSGVLGAVLSFILGIKQQKQTKEDSLHLASKAATEVALRASQDLAKMYMEACDRLSARLSIVEAELSNTRERLERTEAELEKTKIRLSEEIIRNQDLEKERDEIDQRSNQLLERVRELEERKKNG